MTRHTESDAAVDTTLSRSASPQHWPGDELLTAYLTTALPADDQQRIEDHLDHCDQCVLALMTAQHRIAAVNEIAHAIPASVRERQRAARAAGSSAVGARVAGSRPWWSVGGWRALVPAAVALGAIAIVMTSTNFLSTPPRELSRSVPMASTMRVNIDDAIVRLQPSTHADEVTHLSRGTAVQIAGEERDWYHIILPNGTEGWIEQHALR